MGKRKRGWEWGHYGPVSGPVTAAFTSLAVAGWGSEFDLSPWYAVAVAGASALLVLAMDVRRRIPAFASVVHVGAWGFHGWWTWQALATTPWTVSGIASLVAGSAVAVVATQAAAVHTGNVADHREKVQEATRRRGVAGEWEARLVRVCRLHGVRVTGLDEWERPVPGEPGTTRKTGYSVLVELPRGGWRWTDVSSKRLELASDANLPAGCGIEVRSGGTAREVILDVTTMNVLAEDLPLGAIERRSIYDPIPVGIRHDGSMLEVSLKWAWALLIGQTGSGKSNQLTALLAYLLMCDDVVIVGIDFNGGKLFRPYLRPWLRGEAKRPAIAAVATDEVEATALLDFLIGAIDTRSRVYAERMEQADDDKVPASPEVPHIVLVTDESNDLPRGVKARMVELSNRSRAASIRGLTCGLRAVDNGGNGMPIELNAQAAVKIAMQVDGDQELAYLFNWGKAPKCEEIPGVGFGVAGEQGDIVAGFKGPRTKPSTAAEVAAASDEWRPELDAATVGTDRAWWEGRWERAEATWLSGNPTPPATPRSEPAERTAGPPVDPAAGGDIAMEAMRTAMREAGMTVPGEQEDAPSAWDVDEEFRRMAAEQLADVDPEGARVTPASLMVPPLLTRIPQAAGANLRIHMKTAAAAVGLTSRRLAELLRMVGVEPIPHPVEVGGKKDRGYEVADIVAAAAAVMTGARECPREVWDAVEPQ